MSSLFYPAVFHPDDNSYWVSFPDIPEALTEGRDIEEAYAMAVDCLGLSLSTREYDHTALPKASSPESIELKNGEFLVLIEFDLLEYKKRTNMKSVKKTLTIPEWLNQEALSKGINFSQVLQEALISKLHSS